MNLRCLMLLPALVVGLANSIVAQLQTVPVSYVDGELGKFEGTIVYTPKKGGAPRPGILMVPNWMGPTEASLEKAKKIAGEDYFVMMIDMYGADVRPKNSKEAGAAASKVRGDRKLMRARASLALEVFRDVGAEYGLDPDRVAAVGFCFGGGTVLELGRSGAELDAIVAFHGDLKSPTLKADAGRTRARVLVCHGADDPYVPQKDVQLFVDAMKATDVDWQLEQYSGTVHSFTNPQAKSEGAHYNARSAKRAFASMRRLLAEVWGD